MRSLFAPLIVVVTALPALAAPRVEDVKVNSVEGGVDVVIVASEPLTFQSWLKQAPQAIVVDLLEAEGKPRSLPGTGPLKGVEISRHDARGVALTRVTLPLVSTQDYDVSARGNTVTISVFGQGTKAKKVDVASSVNAGAGAPVLVASSEGRIVEGEMGRATATDAPALYAQAAGGGARPARACLACRP